MIRSFEVKLNAAHPELPLFEASAIVGSPSTAFIRRVPATVGTWTITKVYAQAEYPDGTITTVEAAKGAEGVWTATLPATQTSGRVRCGFTVLADGIDENDEPVTGYTLGIADMAVYTRDLVVQPGTSAVVMKYFDTAPTPAKKGDVADHVRSPAETAAAFADADDRHRGFRRDPGHAAPQINVEHHVAEHGDPPVFEALKDFCVRGFFRHYFSLLVWG